MKTNHIDSGKLFIKDIFERWYKVPSYQRPYVWEKDQISDLLDDISFAYENNAKAEYFLGSIVFQTKRNFDGEYVEDDVLDGQQRLTTLFLITAVIRDLTDNPKLKLTCQNIIYQEGNEFSGIPEKIRMLFEIRDEVKSFIDEFIKPEGKTLNDKELLLELQSTNDLSIKNMINAIFYIQSYFRNPENISPENFFKYLNTKVLLIYVASENLDDAFKMFTILNSRGVKLRNSDILKAENLRLIPKEEQKKYAEKWESIENFFKEDFDIFLSHLRTILVKDKARLNLYDEFEKNIYQGKNNEPVLKKGKETFDFIFKFKNIYEELFNKDHSEILGDYKFDNLIAIMQNVLPADFWMPPLLAYYNKFKFEKILIFLEKLDNKFTYDWITALTPTSRIENMNNMLKKIESIDKDNIDELLNDEVFNIKSDELIKILSEDIYGRRFARYILYKLDYLYSGTDKINVPKIISVEHILPQNPAENSIWIKDFTKEQRDKWTNKLGNLVLISRRKNSSQGRLDYKEKKKKYFEKNIELFRNSTKILSLNDQWKIEDIEKNNIKVLAEFKRHYAMNNYGK